MALKKAVAKATKIPAKRPSKKDPKPKSISSKRVAKRDEPLTKSALFALIAEDTQLSRKQVSEVFDSLVIHAKSCLLGAGKEFTVPGVTKLRLIRKPATKARPGRNPFTGESITVKAKPARNVLKLKVLKKLKDMVI